MNIREYSHVDRSACVAIFRSNVPEYFALEEEALFLEFLANPRAKLVCGEEEGEVVAFGGYYVKGGVGRLCWGMVHRQLHRRGIGAELLRARTAALFGEPNVSSIRATTSQQSAAFFARFGFEQISFLADGHAPGLHAVEMQLIQQAQTAPNQSTDPILSSGTSRAVHEPRHR